MPKGMGAEDGSRQSVVANEVSVANAGVRRLGGQLGESVIEVASCRLGFIGA
jgi:hypothetical protein